MNENIIKYYKKIIYCFFIIGAFFILFLYLSEIIQHAPIRHVSKEEKKAKIHMEDAIIYMEKYLRFSNGINKDLILKLINSNENLFKDIKTWDGGTSEALLLTYNNYNIIGIITTDDKYMIRGYDNENCVKRRLEGGGNMLIYDGAVEHKVTDKNPDKTAKDMEKINTGSDPAQFLR